MCKLKILFRGTTSLSRKTNTLVITRLRWDFSKITFNQTPCDKDTYYNERNKRIGNDIRFLSVCDRKTQRYRLHEVHIIVYRSWSLIEQRFEYFWRILGQDELDRLKDFHQYEWFKLSDKTGKRGKGRMEKNVAVQFCQS